jgi:group I intron endonuclease
MKKFTAYRIYCEQTGKSYIGMTSGLRKRLTRHKSNARNGQGHPLYDDVRALGWGAFTIIELASCKDYEAAQELERILITAYNSLEPNGYNLETGGNLGKKIGDLARQKMSESNTSISAPEGLKARWRENAIKVGHANRGMVRSDETKALIASNVSRFAQKRREWAEVTGYRGPLNQITKKMMENNHA